MDIKTPVNVYFNYIIFTKIGSKQRNVERKKEEKKKKKGASLTIIMIMKRGIKCGEKCE